MMDQSFRNTNNPIEIFEDIIVTLYSEPVHHHHHYHHHHHHHNDHCTSETGWQDDQRSSWTGALALLLIRLLKVHEILNTKKNNVRYAIHAANISWCIDPMRIIRAYIYSIVSYRLLLQHIQNYTNNSDNIISDYL